MTEGPIEAVDGQSRLAGPYLNERLSIPFHIRGPGASVTGLMTGFALGASQGGTMAGLRFRAEHAHMFPGDTVGWYFYHKSKNYHVMLGGLREGAKMGLKIGFWTGSFFVVEEAVDRYWHSRSFLSSLIAGGSMAGAFSAWSGSLLCQANADEDKFPAPTAVRTAKKGFKFGLLFGLAQDMIGLVRGRRPFYVDYLWQNSSKAH